MHFPSSYWGSVILNLEEGVASFDRDLKVINANKAALNLLGLASPKGFHGIMGKVIDPEIRKLVFSGVEILNIPLRWSSDANGEKNFLCSFIPVIPEGGIAVQGIIMMIKPGVISSVPPVESWLEWGRQYINQVTLNLREGVCYLDAKGRIIYANRTFEGMSGSVFEDISGKHLASVLKPTSRPLFFMEVIDKTLREGYWQGEFEIHAGEAPRALLATAARVSGDDGKDLGIAIFAHDITERKWLENEMQWRNRELSLIYDLLQLTTAYQDLKDALGQSLARILSIVRAEAGAIYLCDWDTYELQLVAYQGLTYRSARELALGKEGKVLTKKIMESTKGVIISQGKGDAAGHVLSGKRGPLLSLAAVPISSMSRSAGVLMVGHKQSGRFGDQHLLVLLSLASQIGVVFELAGLVEDLRGKLEELAQERDFSRALIDTMPSALVLLDTRGRMGYANQRFTELLGYGLDEVKGVTFNSLIPSGERKRIMSEVMIRERSRGIWLETSLKDKWGDTLPVLITSTPRPFEVGAYRGAIVTITDLSEQRAKEREVEEIEETAKELSQELAGARDTLQKLDARKQAYLSMVHYEVTTPLKNMKQKIADLQKDLGRIDSKEARGRLKWLDREIRRLERLASDIQDVSGIENARLRLRRRELDLGEITSRIIEEMYASGDNPIDLEIRDEPLIGRVDGGRIEQVLMCIIDNSIEFAGPESRVRVGLKRQENEAYWEIEDKGEGMNSEQVESLKDLFAGKDRPGMEVASGLGLLICNHIIEAHGGNLALESAPGRGTRICFSIPL